MEQFFVHVIPSKKGRIHFEKLGDESIEITNCLSGSCRQKLDLISSIELREEEFVSDEIVGTLSGFVNALFSGGKTSVPEPVSRRQQKYIKKPIDKNLSDEENGSDAEDSESSFCSDDPPEKHPPLELSPDVQPGSNMFFHLIQGSNEAGSLVTHPENSLVTLTTQISQILMRNPQTINQISENLHKNRRRISTVLSVLKGVGLVLSSATGKKQLIYWDHGQHQMLKNAPRHLSHFFELKEQRTRLWLTYQNLCQQLWRKQQQNKTMNSFAPSDSNELDDDTKSPTTKDSQNDSLPETNVASEGIGTIDPRLQDMNRGPVASEELILECWLEFLGHIDRSKIE